jgi:hypothetical protein
MLKSLFRGEFERFPKANCPRRRPRSRPHGVVCSTVDCRTQRKSTAGLKHLGSYIRTMDLDFYYRLQLITDSAIPDGFGIFLFVLIIYYGRYTPLAVLSRQMAFELPNFLS